MSRDKKAMEKYLLTRGIGFPNCPKCSKRKEGCHKNCKFIKAYERKKNEQR
jgi:hypothetical protein